MGALIGSWAKFGRAQALELGIEIGEIAPLQQRIVGELDAGHDVLRHERHLLGFGEEVLRHAVEHQPTDWLGRQDFLGYELGWIENVEIEAIGEILVEHLQAQFPFGKCAALDSIPQIAAMEIGIGAVDLDRLVPEHGLHAQLGLPDGI